LRVAGFFDAPRALFALFFERASIPRVCFDRTEHLRSGNDFGEEQMNTQLNTHPGRAAFAASRIVRPLAAAAVAVSFFAAFAYTQEQQPKQMGSSQQDPWPVHQTVFLTHVTGQNDLNDIQQDIRNMFPRMKTYGVSSKMAISLAGTAEEVEAAQKVITELDQPLKTYRITYTVTEFDNGSRGDTQKYVLTAASGQRTSFVAGTKEPILTAAPDKPDSSATAQIQYIDVGLKIEATPQSSAEGLRLDSKVEKSSMAGERPIVGTQIPTIGQTVLDTTATLAEGKPQVLGSVDIPGTANRLEIAVVAEVVK
jgi:type II secretory pathway component GspD/PulD (secretin)